MKHKGIHIPQSNETPEPLEKIAESACAPISIKAPPTANAIVTEVTVLSVRFANASIVSWAAFFIMLGIFLVIESDEETSCRDQLYHGTIHTVTRRKASALFSDSISSKATLLVIQVI